MPPTLDGAYFLRRNPPFESIGPLHGTCLYDAEAARRIGFYTCDILISDFEPLYRLALGRRIGFVPQVVQLWRQHGDNATRTARNLVANATVFEGPARRAVEVGAMSPSEARRCCAPAAPAT